MTQKLKDEEILPPANGVTLIDVAKVAGVSPITVSRALHRPEVVSEKTRQKVQQAVDQVGYIPNMLAGGLASRQTKLVAILVPTISHSIFADLLKAAMDGLSEAGYQSLLGITDYSTEKEEQLLGTILGRRPDAIVLTGTEHTALTCKRLAASGVPVVEAWDWTDDPIDMLVGFSHEAVGAAMAQHLYQQGYRRFVGLFVSDSRAMRRCHAFYEALSALGIEADDAVVMAPPASLKEGREGLRQLLARETRPEVIVCSSDTLAQGVLAEAAERGLKVPDDIAVMGFGDMANASQVYPALSTVRLDGAKVGTMIANALLQRFEDHQSDVRLDMGFELIDRQST